MCNIFQIARSIDFWPCLLLICIIPLVNQTLKQQGQIMQINNAVSEHNSTLMIFPLFYLGLFCLMTAFSLYKD